MDTDKKPRKLDVAESATIDIVSLNNKVVKMRPHVKKAKAQTIQRIIKKIKELNNKKGSEEQKEKNKRKVDRFMEVIQAIKKLRPSRVSKFALANTLTLEEICRKPDTDAETRALARLAEHKALKTVVTKFREEHSDWKALADFLLAHISRRFLSNETERTKIATNRKAGNQLMKSYIENKIGKSTSKEIENRDSSDDESEDDKKLIVKKRKKKELIKNKVNDKVSSKNKNKCIVDIFPKHSGNDDDTNLGKDDVSSVEHKRSSENSESEEEQDGAEGNYESEDEMEDSENLNSDSEKRNLLSFSENSNSGDEMENVENNSDNSDSEIENSNSEDEMQNIENNSDNSNSEIENEKSESVLDNIKQNESGNNRNMTKTSGEMVVKKFNMDDLLNSNDDEVPSFLINQSSEENATQVKKSKDSFFMCGDEEDEENSDIDNRNENESDTDEFDNRKINTDRNIMNSSFIGALNAAKPRHRNFDRGGGRGRGRGQFNKFDKNRGGFHNSEGKGRGFQNLERRRRGSINYERRGRGNFQSRFRNGPQNAPKEFQKSGGRGRGSRGSFDQRQQQRGKAKPSKDDNNSFTGSKDIEKTAEKIHPSWEASKKRKEHLSIQAFQGKKIKFDEN